MPFRYMLSIIASACLWTVLPVALGVLDDKMTPYGRDLFIQGLPRTVGLSFLFFLPVAAVMHWLWAPATIKASGSTFWLLPIKTLPTAYIIGWILLLPIIVIKDRLWLQPSEVFGTSLLYTLLLGAFVVLVSLVWISYPISILNQIVIRTLLRTKQKC